jgi:hypothetical protein
MENLTSNQKPKFKHDCDYCKFLGNFNGADLYFCDKIKQIPTVLARFSNEPSDYKSGLIFAKMSIKKGLFDDHLAQAYMRAKSINLLF